MILADGDAYRMVDFPVSRRPGARGPAAVPPADGDLNLERAERQLIERALKKHGYNISNAAAELGLTRGTLYRRMEKHGL